ncbi:MAG: hypothetical protein ACRDLL_07470 [Solirubrobacterales bacterium]
MKRRSLPAAMVAALVLVGAGSALAGTTSYPSSISVLTPVYDRGGGTFDLAGHVGSTHRACIADRKVKLFVLHQDGSRTLADTDRTSAKGIWGAEMTIGPQDVGKVFVIKKNIGTHRHARICKEASLLLD